MDASSEPRDRGEETHAAPQGRTLRSTFIGRGAGQGVLLGAVAAPLGMLIALGSGADADLSQLAQNSLTPVFVVVAALAGLVVGPVVGVLASLACLVVRESVEDRQLGVRTVAVAAVGGVVAGACAGILALVLSAVIGPATGFVVVATLLGALSAGRTERVWTRRQS
jgi:hypothetical protein